MISFASSNGDIILQNTIQYVFSPIYQLVAGVAVVYFLYGVAKFIYDLNDPEKKAIGKSHLFWGLIGLFIVLSVGGILPGFNTILGGMFKY
jgi:hypothetical protein